MATCAGDGLVLLHDVASGGRQLLHNHRGRAKKLVTREGDPHTLLSCSESGHGGYYGAMTWLHMFLLPCTTFLPATHARACCFVPFCCWCHSCSSPLGGVWGWLCCSCVHCTCLVPVPLGSQHCVMCNPHTPSLTHTPLRMLLLNSQHCAPPPTPATHPPPHPPTPTVLQLDTRSPSTPQLIAKVAAGGMALPAHSIAAPTSKPWLLAVGAEDNRLRVYDLRMAGGASGSGGGNAARGGDRGGSPTRQARTPASVRGGQGVGVGVGVCVGVGVQACLIHALRHR